MLQLALIIVTFVMRAGSGVSCWPKRGVLFHIIRTVIGGTLSVLMLGSRIECDEIFLEFRLLFGHLRRVCQVRVTQSRKKIWKYLNVDRFEYLVVLLAPIREFVDNGLVRSSFKIVGAGGLELDPKRTKKKKIFIFS